jgi:predicted dehydrogenase
MINVGVIGYGYWGPNLVRNFATNSVSSLLTVCDRDENRLAKVKALYPSVKVTTSSDDMINDPAIDAVVVATPVHTHFALAMAALKAGKHVLVEKPIASTVAESQALVDEAQKRNLILLVDHTFVYTGAVRQMHDLVRDPEFGNLRYYDSTRVNLGLFQSDVNVLWDLAVHDLSIMSYVLGKTPTAVSATGHKNLPDQPEYAAFLTVFFDDVIAHINVNWLSPVKIRRTLVGGSNKMIVYDDLETSEKIKLYDKGITVTPTSEEVHKYRIGYRTGDMWSPKVVESEALGVEVSHFAACINGTETPMTGGEAGLELVRILEAADQSMKANGTPVNL